MLENKMNDHKLDGNKIYGIYSLRKMQSGVNVQQLLLDFIVDDTVIYTEKLENLYKIVFEFESELHRTSQLQKLRQINIKLGFPIDDNISYIDRVIEYLEKNPDFYGDKIKKIKDKYSLINN